VALDLERCPLPIYTFHLRKPDGAPGSFEAYELTCDQAAAAQATVLLEQHMSAAQVEVFDHERAVLSRSRLGAATIKLNARNGAW
jgi:hypothetical protein